MKKLLLFLLLPLLSFGQNIQLGLEMFQNDNNQVVDADNPIEEGLLLGVGLHMFAVGSDDFTLLADSRYLFVDIQYNSQVLSLVDEAYDFPALDLTTTGGTIEERYTFSNTSISSRNSDLLTMHKEWSDGSATYSENNAKWSVVRIAIQLSDAGFDAYMDSSTIRTEEPLFVQVFQVKTGVSNITEQHMWINLATIENVDGTDVTSIFTSSADPYPHPIIEAVSYNAKLHFELPEAINPTNFQVTVFEQNSNEARLPITLDAAGDAIISDVDLNKTYYVSNLDPIDRTYLPDVHTVTDAYRSFKYLNDVGINGTDVIYNNFGLFSADANLNGEFTSFDVYGLYAYVLGIDVQTNGGQGAAPEDTLCLPYLDDNGVWYHGCTATVLYENFTIEKLGAQLDILNTGTSSTTQYWNSQFIPTETNLNFDFAFWHHVDLDQSHSTAFPATLTAKSAKSGLNLSSKAVGTTTLDMISKIEDGLVKVELTHSGEDIVGLQARIKYDTSKLLLKNIIYDTGNTLTNFGKSFDGELLFGTLSKDGSDNVKKGKAFTIEFTPKGIVNNTTGLFYFENTDAVKQNGDKMNLNIK